LEEPFRLTQSPAIPAAAPYFRADIFKTTLSIYRNPREFSSGFCERLQFAGLRRLHPRLKFTAGGSLPARAADAKRIRDAHGGSVSRGRQLEGGTPHGADRAGDAFALLAPQAWAPQPARRALSCFS